MKRKAMKPDGTEVKQNGSAAENEAPECEEAVDEIIASLGANH